MKIKKIFKNEYVVGVACSILSLLVGIVYSAIIARYLGPDLKGQTAYVSSIAGIIGMFLAFGLHQLYPYYRKDDPDIKYKYMNNIYFIFTVYLVVMVAVGIAFRQDPVVISILVLALAAAYMKVVGYVYTVENSVKKNMLMLVIHIMQLLYALCLFLFTKETLFWGVTTLIFIDLALSVIYTVKLRVPIDLKQIDFRFIGKLFVYGVVPMITILASKLCYKVDILMLEAYPNVSMAQIGVYSVGVMLAEKVLLVPAAVKDILVSRLSKGKDAEEVARVMRLCFPLCLVMFLGITLLGDWFINLVYGGQYDDAYRVTVVTMFGVVAVMFHRMIERYNIVHHQQKFTLFVVVTSTLVNVGCNIFMIPAWGILGAAIATVISYIYATVVCLIVFARQTGLKIRNMIFITKGDIVMLKKMFSKKKPQKKTGDDCLTEDDKKQPDESMTDCQSEIDSE